MKYLAHYILLGWHVVLGGLPWVVPGYCRAAGVFRVVVRIEVLKMPEDNVDNFFEERYAEKLAERANSPFEFTEPDFFFLMEDCQGVCAGCGDVVECCEPDARFRRCESCGEDLGFGAEEALVRGLINVGG